MKGRLKKWGGNVGMFLHIAAFPIGFCSIFLGVFPLVFRVFHAGCVGLIVYGVAAIGLSSLWNRFDGWGRVPRRLHEVSDLRRPFVPAWWRRLRMALLILLCVLLIAAVILSGFMLYAAQQRPGPDATVIVLGAKVYGAQPSLMLQRRLNMALDYLNGSPGSYVVCAGGLTPGDPYSEAQVMASYLMAKGIASERILLDERSVNTQQNLAFAAQRIQEVGCSSNVAIATDAFHELRGAIYARRAGLTPYALPAVTPWGIAPSYWVREWFGLAASMFF